MNRRTLLRSAGALAAGCASGAATAVVAASVTPSLAAASAADPCLAFVTAWNAAADQCAAAADDASADVWIARCQPFERAAFLGEIPGATTASGAAAAIRKALNFGDMQQQDEALLRAALAYLDGAAA